MNQHLATLNKYIQNYYNFPSSRLFFFENNAFHNIETDLIKFANNLSLNNESIIYTDFTNIDEFIFYINTSNSHLIFIQFNQTLSETELNYLNMHRENLFKNKKLMFFISNELNINNFISFSPDLFSWRSSSVFS